MIRFDLAGWFFDKDRFDKCELVKLLEPCALNRLYILVLTMDLQAWSWYKRGRLQEAMVER